MVRLTLSPVLRPPRTAGMSLRRPRYPSAAILKRRFRNQVLIVWNFSSTSRVARSASTLLLFRLNYWSGIFRTWGYRFAKRSRKTTSCSVSSTNRRSERWSFSVSHLTLDKSSYACMHNSQCNSQWENLSHNCSCVRKLDSLERRADKLAIAEVGVQVGSDLQAIQADLSARLEDAEAMVLCLRRENEDQRREMSVMKATVNKGNVNMNGRSYGSNGHRNRGGQGGSGGGSGVGQEQNSPRFPPVHNQSYWYHGSRGNNRCLRCSFGVHPCETRSGRILSNRNELPPVLPVLPASSTIPNTEYAADKTNRDRSLPMEGGRFYRSFEAVPIRPKTSATRLFITGQEDTITAAATIPRDIANTEARDRRGTSRTGSNRRSTRTLREVWKTPGLPKTLKQESMGGEFISLSLLNIRWSLRLPDVSSLSPSIDIHSYGYMFNTRRDIGSIDGDSVPRYTHTLGCLKKKKKRKKTHTILFLALPNIVGLWREETIPRERNNFQLIPRALARPKVRWEKLFSRELIVIPDLNNREKILYNYAVGENSILDKIVSWTESPKWIVFKLNIWISLWRSVATKNCWLYEEKLG